jgi:hypothetical protein
MTKLIRSVGAKKANPKPIQKGMRGLLFRDWVSFAPATRTTAVPKVKEVRIIETLYPSPAAKTSYVRLVTEPNYSRAFPLRSMVWVFPLILT